MPYHRNPFQKDANHNELVRIAAQLGFEAWDMTPYGFPADLYVVKNCKSAWIEIKDGRKAPSRRKLKKNSEDFRAFLRRNGTELFVVNNQDELIALLRNLLVGEVGVAAIAN